MAKYPMLIVLEYRDDLDRALRRRGVDPYYIVNAPMHTEVMRAPRAWAARSASSTACGTESTGCG